MKRLIALSLSLALAAPAAAAGPPYKALILDGQNNHDWKATTPVLKKILEDTKLFKVDVATFPEAPRPPHKPPGNDADEQKRYEIASATYDVDRKIYKSRLERFRPKFADYQVVVSNYNGDRWSDQTEADFLKYVRDGGGFVSVHAADNAFPGWPEYNAIIGLGGWGGRGPEAGPFLRLREGKFVADRSKGPGGAHGARHPFVVETRAKDHPVTAGLPEKWMHARDELYRNLRGPAQDLTVLASATCDPKYDGSSEVEPVLMAISYGKGRSFHTTLGHDLEAMQCAGFQTTLARGAEWAANGKVTQKVPADFPTADKESLRKP